MNQVNPRKLLNSKWTAVNPEKRERHFIVTAVEFDENGAVIHCEIEAVLSKRVVEIEWRELKDSERWLHGWK